MSHRFRIVFIASLALLGAGCATPGRLTILESVGPSNARFPEGARVAPGERLVLRPGDRVIIVQDNLFIRTFRGPGTFLARMTGGEDQRRPRVGTGAVRSMPLSTDPDPARSRFIVCPQDRRCPR
jgi:hypothetical protein